MGLKDLIITPIYIVLFTAIAFFIRPYVTNKQTRKYFLPALWVRFAGAIALGLVYQFYYDGGDTFNYWTHGSQWITKAFSDDFSLGLSLMLEKGGTWNPTTFAYTSNIWYYRDPASYSIVKLAALTEIASFHTYTASSLFFAVFGFSGSWAMYSAINFNYPGNSGKLALAILLFPSVVFWGSGILKDTITLGALGWMIWALLRWINLNKRGFTEILIFLVSFLIIYRIKMYILLCFMPMIGVWLFLKSLYRIRNIALKIILAPILLIVFGISGYLTLNKITEDNKKYGLENLAERVQITAYDIRYGWGARTGGVGGYDIGLPDGTWQGMFSLMPAAINVSLFRPYFWEVKNPMMLLAALESFFVFIFTFRVLIMKGLLHVFKDPFLFFCFSFSLIFAFAVGVSTFNFGTLMRYKIPLIPLFLSAIFISSISAKKTFT